MTKIQDQHGVRDRNEVVPVRPLSTEQCLYAHTPDQTGKSVWHLWSDHAVAVAELAAEFAAPFGGSSLCRLAGLVHDAGKLTAEVQDALRARAVDGGAKLGAPHKLEGAALAGLLLEAGNVEAARVMALMNFGHHNQIPDLPSPYVPVRAALNWMNRFPGHLDALVTLIEDEVPFDLRELANNVTLPEWLHKRLDYELFTRMCHSALVDADYLDTAGHFNGSGTPARSETHGMESLREEFVRAYAGKHGSHPAAGDDVGAMRWDYFERARTVGEQSPLNSGIYRLPAPTGSGKTMSSAIFALSHAVKTEKRRVIVAVPYTSITTQNANVYRQMFQDLGDEIVLEHHSNILDDATADNPWRRLAAENWDAEFIVTTTVQLLESLFDNRPRATRKLHRIANSVVIIDEVQALPVELVPAILQMMRELSDHYGVTFLLSSATQPSFWSLPEWAELKPIDLAPVDYIPPITRRVRYDVRAAEQPWEDIANELSSERQALTIVNTTTDAQRLHRLVQSTAGDGVVVLHLSTRMYSRHRAVVLEEAKARLANDEPIILISTQLIEAGVDIDFPVVFRALGPADSVVQSAGRCNREGRLGTSGGRVVVFQPLSPRGPSGAYRTATEHTRAIFIPQQSAAGSPPCFGDPTAMADYYTLLYGSYHGGGQASPSTTIREHREKLKFEATRTSFQMIDDRSIAVLINDPIDETDRVALDALIERLCHPAYVMSRAERRTVSALSASIPRAFIQRYPGMTEQLAGGPLLWTGEYDPECGVVVEAPSEATIW
ncbi:CRISPR-associated helicase Cas3' [Gordonia sp. (in: high G+C Gram-positive bacteria)]|uniref:CRISPR-associated helicase Cas3' n=1 Tax=Gordonia sp. (in: high G+C Gram-positive bacteria) TaxID=84139 RepID=UPI0026237B74|nr:CRISPR-associated helicase Cas3' [Gordonia sp. (in: high G+C Gram-positive bacteria)]HMS75569.1 CRISPR-associated helicase Cas3' [Gordonia sp. (in: high G+C Gram-positive bacteria)]HQV16858.1 CRISPR-associated helicase Cas3' [Gordonia sp. (in: high G+C Gram-positive bacteria)]